MHVLKGAFVGLAPDGYARSLAARDLSIAIGHQAGDNSGGAAGAASVAGEQGETASAVLLSNRRAWNLPFFQQHGTIPLGGSGAMQPRPIWTK